MLGFFLYLSTIAYAPHFMMMGLFLYPFLFRRKELNRRISENKSFFVGFLIYIVIALINLCVHISMGYPAQLPYYIISISMLITGIALNSSDIRVFIYFVAFEAGVGLYELYLGVPTILPGVALIQDELSGGEMLYDNRVAGLSVGVATYASKLLLALILLHLERVKYHYIIKILFWTAIILCFNRTTIISGLIFEISLIFFGKSGYATYSKTMKRVVKTISFLFIGGLISLIIKNIEFIIFQFTRGSNSLDVSGRDLIWVDFIAFIKENLLFGYGSMKYEVATFSGMLHAHNSYLQLIANHGIIIGGFLMLVYLSKVNRANISYVLPIAAYCVFQYGIFWGISLTDIVFIAILCHKTTAIQPQTKPKTA